MKPEKRFWKSLAPKLRAIPGLRAQRVENSASSSIPDLYLRWINYHWSGWVELKAVDKNLKRGESFELSHLTPGQGRWASEQWAANRNCWLLLKIGGNYALIPGNKVHTMIGRPMTTECVMDLADLFWVDELRGSACRKMVEHMVSSAWESRS